MSKMFKTVKNYGLRKRKKQIGKHWLDLDMDRVAQLEQEMKALEDEKKANYRRIAELTEREVNYKEVHTAEIHGLRKRNFEISIDLIFKKNEIRRTRCSEPPK